MNPRTEVLARSLLVGALFAMPALAADDEALRKDLAAVIALQGLPCGEVVAVKEQAQNDYVASCKDSNVYHVYLNVEGGVIVETQKADFVNLATLDHPTDVSYRQQAARWSRFGRTSRTSGCGRRRSSDCTSARPCTRAAISTGVRDGTSRTYCGSI